MVTIMMQADAIQVPLTLLTRIAAKQFSQQQSHPDKAKQVYLNTLAVAAVNSYLQCAGWRTNLESSNSWQPLMQTLMDTADLQLPDCGFIECRPVTKDDRVAIIPEEAMSERIAYVAVEIEESGKSAYLLGFVPQVSSSTIALSSLKAIAKLPEYLARYRSRSMAVLELPQLSHWLLGKVEAGWEFIDTILTPRGKNVQMIPAYSNFRTGMISSTSLSSSKTQTNPSKGVSRVKIWDIEKGGYYRKIALVISIFATEKEELEISIKVCPTNEQTYLPQGLIIKILDETQQSILQAQTKDNNENIEFFLSGETGETFSIQVIFNDEIKMESFMI